MNAYEIQLMEKLLAAYSILREAYHHDIHREKPALTELECEVKTAIVKAQARISRNKNVGS